MHDHKQSVILIAGPTAVGKSGCGVGLAKAIGGAIINADSMQVYRQLKILTARPTPEQMEAVPHHLFGTISAARNHSVGEWLEAALDCARACMVADQTPIFVGGTGLYFKALLEGLSPVPEIDPAVRRHVRELADEGGAAALWGEIERLDPEGAASLDRANPQRLARALEVVMATGRPLRDWHAERASPRIADIFPPGRITRIVLERPRELLYEGINDRVHQMLDLGALDEVRSIRALGLSPTLPVMRAIGVPPLGRHLDGQISLEEAINSMQQDSRRYAKRQITWSRNQMGDWTRLDAGAGGLAANIRSIYAESTLSA